ncbi:hypothetical protein P7K49_027623 [Saguinus oedipus]|uniref:Uncharacterized protein n=1 Tax=Saguinus oedipus TaxID=9490 RepID=A0ABQ9UAW7_SAGOE|nr:hypothetical protein P7K49_027623 [Saguinus oedipus]
MVTAEKDFVLTPQMSKHMEDWVRERPCTGVISAPQERHRCSEGSWQWRILLVMQMGPRLKHFPDRASPTEVNQILIEWLESDARNPLVTSKI